MDRRGVLLLVAGMVFGCSSTEPPIPTTADTTDASAAFDGAGGGTSTTDADAEGGGVNPTSDAALDVSSEAQNADATVETGSAPGIDAGSFSDAAALWDAAPCVPDCTSRICGDSDGCGGPCAGSAMACPGGGTCDALGACTGGCVASCAGKDYYANDGCGGRCQSACVTDGGVTLHSDPPGAPQTSESLIYQAQKNGSLPDVQAAYYELLAQHVPYLLPAQYQSSVPSLPPGSVVPHLITSALFSSLDAQQQAVVTALSVEPVDPEFMVFSDAALALAGPAPNPPPPATCASTYKGAYRDGASVFSKYFEFIAVKPKQQAADPSSTGVYGRMLKWLYVGVDADGGPISDTPSESPNAGTDAGTDSQIPPFAQYLDKVFEYFLSIGMKDPRPLMKDAGVPVMTDAGAAGGLRSIVNHQGRIAVYVAGCDAAPNAFAYPNGHILAADSIALRDPWFRRITLPHELFHIFEFAYGVPLKDNPDGSIADRAWPFEAAAVAMEDAVSPSVQRWSGERKAGGILPAQPPWQSVYRPINRFFVCPEERFHSVANDPNQCDSDPKRVQPNILYRGDYSKFVYFKFMMENRASFNMPNFWTHYAQNQGNPSSLVWPDDLAELNVALLADVKGRAPYFTPEARQAMAQRLLPPMKKGDTPKASDPTRYTATVLESEYSRQGKNAGWKLTPNDPVYTGNTEQPFSAKNVIRPGATHRWLINLPPEAEAAITSQPWTESPTKHTVAIPFSIIVKVDTGENQLLLTTAPLDGPPSQPGQTVNFDNEGPAEDLYPTPDPSSRTVTDCTATWFPYEQKTWRVSNTYSWEVSDGPSPAHVLVTITNGSAGANAVDAAYRLGVSLPAKCFEQCAAHYAAEWVHQGCADLACQDCKPDSGCCPDQAQCLQAQSDPTKLFFGSAVHNNISFVGYGDGLCKQFCGGYAPTYDWSPVLPVCNGGPNAFLTPNEKLGPLASAFCTKADCTTEPYGFVSIPEWPDLPGGICNGCAGCNCMQFGVSYGEWCLFK
jgi:hypothetical protein